MNIHKFIAALFIIVVEIRAAKFDTVEIKLGRRNVIIPLNGPVQVKRFKPEELNNLKISIPDLVELVAKVQGRPSPPAPPPPPPGLSLPPDRFHSAPQYEPPHSHSSYQLYHKLQVPNHSKVHIPRNYPDQPKIIRDFSEYPQQEYHSELVLPQQYYPLPYREYEQPINHPEQTVQGATQHYPLLYTPNHSYLKPNVTSVENSFPQTVHTTEPHLESKPTNGIHPYKEEIEKTQSPTFHHADGHFATHTNGHPQAKASIHNHDPVPSHGTHYELPPNISSWLHDHEILEHVQSKKPALRNKALSPSTSFLHRSQPTFAEKGTSTHTSGSSLLEDTDTLKDRALEKTAVTSHPTYTIKKDKVTSHPKSILKMKVVTSQPTSIHEENTESLPSTSMLKENAVTKHLAGTTKPNIMTSYPKSLPEKHAVTSHSILVSEEGIVTPKTTSIFLKDVKEVSTEPQLVRKLGDNVTSKSIKTKTADRREQNTSYQIPTTNLITNTQNTNMHTQRENTTANSHEIYTQLATDSPVPTATQKQQIRDTSTNIQKSSTEHGKLPVSKDAPALNTTTQLQIPYSKTARPSLSMEFISSPKHDTTTNAQEMHTLTKTDAPAPIIIMKSHVKDLMIDNPTITFSKNDRAINTQEIYSYMAPDTTNAPPLNITTAPLVSDSAKFLTSSFSKHDTTPKTLYAQDPRTDIPVTISPEDGTTLKVQEIVTPIMMDKITQDITTSESLARNLSTTAAPALNITLGLYVTDSATDVPVTTANTEEMSIDVTTQSITTTTTSSPGYDTITKARNIIALTITDASALNIATESHLRDSTTDIPTSSFFEADTIVNAQKISTHISVDELTINTVTELNVPTDVPATPVSEHDTTISEIEVTTLDDVDISFPEYDTTTQAQDIYAHKIMDALAINTAPELHSQDALTDIHTKDIIKVNPQESYAGLSTTPPASNTVKKTLTQHTTKYPQERYSQTDAFILITTTESTNILTTLRTDLDTITNAHNINYSTSTDTPEVTTITKPYTKDLSIDPMIYSPEHDKSKHIEETFMHINTGAFVLNETKELYVQNSATNRAASSFEDNTKTNIEEVYTQGQYTTTETPLHSTESLTITFSTELITEMSPPLQLTPVIDTTVETPAPLPSPQNKTKIDAVTTAKRRHCKHARRKACGSTGKAATTGKRRRRRRRRTTRAPKIPSPAPGNI